MFKIDATTVSFPLNHSPDSFLLSFVSTVALSILSVPSRGRSFEALCIFGRYVVGVLHWVQMLLGSVVELALALSLMTMVFNFGAPEQMFFLYELSKL